MGIWKEKTCWPCTRVLRNSGVTGTDIHMVRRLDIFQDSESPGFDLSQGPHTTHPIVRVGHVQLKRTRRASTSHTRSSTLPEGARPDTHLGVTTLGIGSEK